MTKDNFSYGSFGLQDYGNDDSTFSLDPVCRRSVEKSHAAGKTTYAGQTHYFCSEKCQRLFEEDPGEYIGQPK